MVECARQISVVSLIHNMSDFYLASISKIVITFYPVPLDNFGDHIWNQRILLVSIYAKIKYIEKPFRSLPTHPHSHSDNSHVFYNIIRHACRHTHAQALWHTLYQEFDHSLLLKTFSGFLEGESYHMISRLTSAFLLPY